MGGGFPEMTTNSTNLQKIWSSPLRCTELTNGFPAIPVWLNVETWCGGFSCF